MSTRPAILGLLREGLCGIERQYYSIDVALAFMNALPAEEVTAYFRTRGILEEMEAGTYP